MAGGIKQSVVHVFEYEAYAKELVAYIVLDDLNLSKEEIYSYASQYLPQYMLPASLSILDTMPLNQHGKIDKKQLIPPAFHINKKHIKKPRNHIEKQLVDIWCAVLNLAELSIDDNFFDVGGDSLSAIRLLAESHKKSLPLTTQLLFEYSSIEMLAPKLFVLGKQKNNRVEQYDHKVILLPEQQKFFELASGAYDHHLRGSGYIPLSKPLDKTKFLRAYQEVLKMHPVLYSYFESVSETYVQRYRDFSDQFLVFEHIQSKGKFDDVLSAKIDMIMRKLSVNNGPLIACVWIEGRDKDPGKLLLLMHTLVSDLASRTIFLMDLRSAYSQLQRDESICLPDVPMNQYAWQKYIGSYVQSDEVTKERQYWQQYESWKLLNLYEGRQKENLFSTIETYTLRLSSVQSVRIFSFAKNQVIGFRDGLRAVIVSAYGYAFSHINNKAVLSIDVRTIGRPRNFLGVDLSRTIGALHLHHPVHLKINSGDPVMNIINQVNQEMLKVPQGGLGFNISRFFHPDASVREFYHNLARSTVFIHCAGNVDTRAAPRLVPEWGLMDSKSFGNTYAPDHQRPYQLEINARKEGDELCIEFSYSRALHGEEIIKEYAGLMSKYLLSI
jgi:hypothetical protein